MPEAAAASQPHGGPGDPDGGTSGPQGGEEGKAPESGDAPPPPVETLDPGGEDPHSAPGVVVYLVDPFNYGPEAEGPEGPSRLALLGLLRGFQGMGLPDHAQANLSLQILPLRSIMEHQEPSTRVQLLKSIAFSVFTSAKWSLGYSIMGRPLTGFGPAAAAELLLRKKAGESSKLYSPPFILSSTKNRQNMIMEAKSEHSTTVLFCGYCLSEDQRWLLAVITDDKGELMEHRAINIHIPNRNRRKKASARRPGLQKLWNFILHVVSLTCSPTRLVIGRFGRMGHGELKGWSGLLSKKNLQSASKRLKDMCTQCEYNAKCSTEVPCVLSACLVSMETHPSFQVMVDSLKAEEKPCSNIPLQTPRDASVTHILVFPTSATAMVNAVANPLQPDHQNDFVSDGLEGFGDVFDDIVGGAGGDDGMNLFDIFGSMPFTGGEEPPLSPNSKANRSFSTANGASVSDPLPGLTDPQEEVNLLQQPLAMGYYISTAPPGPLPSWFWSACPENQFTSPYIFKSALHINESSKHDDFGMPKADNSSKPHVLDSHMTCDVLRYVLENYNSLSWLTFDPVLNDRRSCLPVHLVVLMQLYHALNSFV